jgi:hypothetical protein
MRALLLPLLLLPAVCGCAGGLHCDSTAGQPAAMLQDNPMLVQVADHQALWETVSDVVDDYFKIEREEPVRLIGNTLTEGRLETFPEPSPTILEPWRHDTASPEQRIENTLQSIRRRARVRVIPAGSGYWVEVHVLKELEDVLRPEHSTAGAATARYDDTLTRIVNPIGGQEVNRGWIPQGRDCVLEQRILGHIRERLGATRCPPRTAASPTGAATLGATQRRTQSYCVQIGRSETASYETVRLVRCQMPPATPEPVTVAEPLKFDTVGCEARRTDCDGEFSSAGQSGIAATSAACYERLSKCGHDISLDYQHFYSCPSLALAAAAMGTGAVLANTNLDQQFQNWYQADVRTSGTDGFSGLAKELGNGYTMIPVFAGAALLGPLCRCTPAGEVVGQWGDRCVRSVLVGGPPVLLLQWGLGAARPSPPGDDSHNSYWRPFADMHAVSGHAFIGALAFINAAKMCDNILFKALMYGLSTLPGWSRINDNDHYLSQVVLGWSFAYLAATAVDHSEQSKHQFTIVPLPMDGGMGVGATCQW